MTMAGILRRLWHQRALIFFIIIPVILLPIAFVDPQPKWQCAYVVALMACYWLTQVIPIAVTSLLPIILFPMFGILTSKKTAMIYMSDTALMLYGGMVVAAAIEVWDLHRRIALRVLLLIGTDPRRLMLGLMLSTWFLSMWISNTATTAMMIPISGSIVKQLNHQEGDEERLREDTEEVASSFSRSINRRTNQHVYLRMCKGLTLSIAYAANIGGMATLTGTTANMVLEGQIDQLFTNHDAPSPVTYGLWMAACVPLSFILLLIAWAWLQIFFLPRTCRTQRCCGRDTQVTDSIKALLREEYGSLGPVTFPQYCVLTFFILLVVLWFTRDMGGAGGWGQLFPDRFVSDATSAIAVSVLPFILPSKNPFRTSETCASDEGRTRLLSWQQLSSKMPWSVVLLVGGGFSLAKGCQISGLSEWIGERLESVSDFNPTGTLVIVCYVVTAATEITSNVAITNLLLPVLSQLALVSGVNPMYYMLPATLSASLAFLLPVATPPNAIVFTSGYVKVIDMVLAGLVLNILSVPLVVMATETWGKALFGLDVFPDSFRNMTLSSNSSVPA